MTFHSWENGSSSCRAGYIFTCRTKKHPVLDVGQKNINTNVGQSELKNVGQNERSRPHYYMYHSLIL